MPLLFQRARTRLSLEQLESRTVPSLTVVHQENFDSTSSGQLPSDWSQWSSTGRDLYSTSATRAVSGHQSLTSRGTSREAARSWFETEQPADSGVQASVYTDSLVPVELFVRGKNLDSSKPTYYGVSITRGLQIEVTRVVDGQSTTLASIKTSQYLSGRWICVRLVTEEDQLSVQVMRADTGQYLNGSGQWVSEATAAITVRDSTITDGGYSGINRVNRYAGDVLVDDFAVLGESDRSLSEDFNTTAVGSMPDGWRTWSNSTTSNISTAKSSGSNGNEVRASGTSSLSTRAWISEETPADIQVSASVYVDTLIPAQLFVRGSKLDSSTPTYYAVQVSRGLNIEVVKVEDGKTTTLASLKSASYVSNTWIRVTFTAQGDQLQVRVQRTDNGKWLDKDGNWQDREVAALDVVDRSIQGKGQVGVGRPASYAGTSTFDDFAMTTRREDITAPTMALDVPGNSGALSGEITITLRSEDPSGIGRYEIYLDDALIATGEGSNVYWKLDTRDFNNGSHTLRVRVYDTEGNVAETERQLTFENDSSINNVNIGRKYSHIRVAMLAYSGNPMGNTEKKLLQESVDLVISATRYLSTIESTSSSTPQLIYTNLSNLYGDLLTDWLAYADQNGLDREAAFYHVSEATSFSGSSPSSIPVNWFWNVSRGPNSGTTGYTRLTSASRDSTSADVSFGGTGQSLYIGYTEKFRELNFTLSQGKGAGWSYVIEYATATDAQGNPTAWNTLTVQSDSTNGLSKSGQMTFDPPKDWVTATVSGSTASLYYVRVRVISGASSSAPLASTIHGRDYVQAKGQSSGVIPSFDYAADKDKDGYLNDAEYANRTTGKDARFVYESRVFYPYYGQQRFMLNPASAATKAWAAEYLQEFLKQYPQADGLFVDNSSGEYPANNIKTIESTDTYSYDYVALLGVVKRTIAPKWLMTNTSNGGDDTPAVVRQSQSSFEEFGIRAQSHTWKQFNDTAAKVSSYLSARSPSTYVVLDALSTGGSPSSSRTQMATLAYYYLIGDSTYTFLSLWGGEEPASSWSRHWFQAISYNVGQAQSSYSVFATGQDPANTSLTYYVYQRQYSNALVLYKPLSYTLGKGTGTTANDTATTHQLDGRYRVLNADGTLGNEVTQVTLRNGEGVVLIKVS